MKSNLFNCLKILLIVLGVTRTSYAGEVGSSDDNLGLGLFVYESIEKQQKFHRGKHAVYPKGITLERVNYDDSIELQPDGNIYYVPKAKNPLAFLFGRCNCMHYTGRHPKHDCCPLLPIPILNIKNGVGACGNVIFFDLIANVLGGVVTLPRCPHGALCCTPQVCCPLIFTGASSGCLTGMYLSGYIFYECSKYQGNQDFVDSYDRGQLCLPDDMCSCTNLTGTSLTDWKRKFYESNLYKWFQRC